MMSWGPLPSQLCLLSSLQDRPVGNKVRFLGCVTAYSTTLACLSLGHMYPPGTNASVSVNIELLLETIQPELTRVGEWVNVIGYITAKPESRPVGVTDKNVSCVHVQALLVWSTGPLDIGRYEKGLEGELAPR